jgi:carbon monoxide dehydrogenase subunit G
MKFSEQFCLNLEPDVAYELLLDLDQVVPCLPGAQLGGERDDGSRVLQMAVKLGPMRFSYEGTVRIAEQDPEARRAVLAGSAREARGQGSADGVVAMQVAPGETGSIVTAEIEANLAGRAAQMGQGVVQPVVRELMRQMTACLERRVSAPAAAPAAGEAAAAPSRPPETEQPLRAGSLLLRVVRSWFRRLRRRAA